MRQRQGQRKEGGRASPQLIRQHRSMFRGKGLVSYWPDMSLRGSGPAGGRGGEMPGKQVDVPVRALQTGLGRN